MTQHKAAVGLNEATRQGRCCHAVIACHCVGLHPIGGHASQHNATQIHDKRGLLGHITRT
jgi:hypothetical protein